MNAQEAKSILLLYRPGTADAQDPQFSEALALAKGSPELSLWFEMHCARYEALRAKFKEIAPPAGLKEQIISEHAAARRTVSPRSSTRLVLAALLLLLLGTFAFVWLPRNDSDNSLALYQNEMASAALRGYAMDVTTNNAAPIRAYLAQNHAPSDFKLPAALQKMELVGCAIQEWQDKKVSMVCFRTGKPLEPGMASDLWLFVVDRKLVKDAPTVTAAQAQIDKVNRLITASWTDGNKFYFLGTPSVESDIKQYM